MDNWCDKNSGFPYIYDEKRYNETAETSALTYSEILHCADLFRSSGSWIRVLENYFGHATRRLKTDRMLRTQMLVYGLGIGLYLLGLLYCLHTFLRLHRSKIRFSWFQLSLILWDMLAALSGFLFFVQFHVVHPVATHYECLAPYVTALLTVFPELVAAIEWGNLILMNLFCLDRIRAIRFPVQFRTQDHGRQCLRANLISLIVGLTCFAPRLTFQIKGLEIPRIDIEDDSVRANIALQSAFSNPTRQRYDVNPRTLNDAICFQRGPFTRFCSQEPAHGGQHSDLQKWLTDARNGRFPGFCEFENPLSNVIQKYVTRSYFAVCLILFTLSISLTIVYRLSAVHRQRNNNRVAPIKAAISTNNRPEENNNNNKIPPSGDTCSSKPPANAGHPPLPPLTTTQQEQQEQKQQKSDGIEKSENRAAALGSSSIRHQPNSTTPKCWQEPVDNKAAAAALPPPHHRKAAEKRRRKQKLEEAHERAVIISIISESGITVLKGFVRYLLLSALIDRTFVYEVMYIVKLCMTSWIILATSRVYRKEFFRPLIAYFPCRPTTDGTINNDNDYYDLKLLLIATVLLYSFATVSAIVTVLISLYAF